MTKLLINLFLLMKRVVVNFRYSGSDFFIEIYNLIKCHFERAAMGCGWREREIYTREAALIMCIDFSLSFEMTA